WEYHASVIASPTSYALLGLLRTAPGSAYELVQRMGRNYRLFWPRAESKLYEELKRLVGVGHAVARRERTGRRPRAVYALTPAGRRALARWIRTAGAGPVLECEALVKLMHTDLATKAQVRAQLAAIIASERAIIALGRRLGATASSPSQLLVW